MQRSTWLACLLLIVFKCGGSDSGGTGGTGNDAGASDGNTVFNPPDAAPGTDETPGPGADGGPEDTAIEDVPLKPGPSLTAYPLSVNFGTLPPGASQTTTITLSNNGDQDLTLSSVKLGSLPEEGFSWAGAEPTGLIPAGEEMKIGVTFSSPKLGQHSSTIQVQTLPTVSPLTIALSAIVSTQPSSVIVELTSTAAGLKFGAVLVGTSKQATFQLVNSGTQALQVVEAEMEATSSPDFTFVTDPALPIILPKDSKINVTVTYAPKEVGPDAGTIDVVNSSPNTPTLKVPMTGSGYTGPCAGELVCAPNPVLFGAVPFGQPKAVSVVCSNKGFGPVVVQSIDVGLDPADGFGWTAPALPKTLNGGEALAVPILFTPKDASQKSGQVTVTSDDCKLPVQELLVTASGKPALEPPPCLPPGKFEPKIQWEWTANDAQKAYSQVFMAPIVVNLDDDDGDGDVDGEDIPEVVFTAHKGGFPAGFNDDTPAVLRALHGKDGSLMWVNGVDLVSYGAGLAAAELDGLPGPEIVAVLWQQSPPGQKCPFDPTGLLAICGKYQKGQLIAFHGKDGSVFWKSEPWSGAVTDTENLGAPTIADLDGDGLGEVILGNNVFSGINGSLLWVGKGSRGNDGHGPIGIVADLDNDGKPEVLAGNTAYRSDGTALWTAEAKYGDTHGTAAADIDQNGTMDVFITGPSGQSAILDGKTGNTTAGPVDTGYSGCCVVAPAIADLDAAAAGLEIATVGGAAGTGPDGQSTTIALMRIYDKTLNLLWSKEVSDSTGAAGPSAFDVEGDGSAEVIFADEQNVWIFRGDSGEVIFKGERFSRTGLDLPVIADVDGDHHADIVFSMEGGFGASPGIRVYANADDSWVATRRIWNQHAYGVTNIFDNAALPPFGLAPSLGPLLMRTNIPTCK